MALQIFEDLHYVEKEHGWALDVGSFLAAWAMAIRGLVDSRTNEARIQFMRYARLYTFNIVRRLADHEIKIDARTFEPKNLREMLDVLSEVTAKIQLITSNIHCTFLLLGSATTYTELGLKSGMPVNYYDQLNESAITAIRQIQDLGIVRDPSEMQPETIRIELLRLQGNVDSLRRTLVEQNSDVGGILAADLDQKQYTVVYERELSVLMADAAI